MKILNQGFFNEFTIELPKTAADIVEKLAGAGIIAGYPAGGNKLIVAATEMTTDDDIETLAVTLEEVLG